MVHGSRARKRAASDASGAEWKLLSVREVAAQLGVCTATVYGLVARGEIAQVRVSNAIRIAAADLAAYVASGRRQQR